MMTFELSLSLYHIFHFGFERLILFPSILLNRDLKVKDLLRNFHLCFSNLPNFDLQPAVQPLSIKAYCTDRGRRHIGLSGLIKRVVIF